MVESAPRLAGLSASRVLGSFSAGTATYPSLRSTPPPGRRTDRVKATSVVSAAFAGRHLVAFGRMRGGFQLPARLDPLFAGLIDWISLNLSGGCNGAEEGGQKGNFAGQIH